MGEAWFMGDERLMFDYLLGNLDECLLDNLIRPLEEIALGNSCFGPRDEWTRWYRYLLAQLVTRHAERSYYRLYQHLVTAFIALNPRGIVEPYPGFAEDAMQTLGRCLMDPSRWAGEQFAVSAPEDPLAGTGNVDWDWDAASGDFSAALFLCAKYLPEDELPAWLDSVFAIRCPLWTTQLHVWLLDAYPLLSGAILELGEFKIESESNVQWDGAHVLHGDFSGIYTPEPKPIPLLSPSRREAVLASAQRNVSEERYFAWLDGIKPYAYLEASLYDKPSKFAEVFRVA